MGMGRRQDWQNDPSDSQMEDSLARLIQAVGEAAYTVCRSTKLITWLGTGHRDLLGLDDAPYELAAWEEALTHHVMKGRSAHLSREEAKELFWTGGMADWECECCFQRPDGSTRWLRNHLVPRFSPDGEVIGGTGVLRDIQTRVDREIALAEAEARSRAIIERAPVGIHIYELDDQGVLRFAGWNSAAADLTGHSYPKLLGQELHHAFRIHRETKIADHYLRLAKEGGTWEGSIVWSPEPGCTLHHEISAFACDYGQVVAFFTDVTEKVESARRLENSEHKFRGLVESISEAVLTVSAAGVITYASPAISTLIQAPVDAIVDHSFSEIIAPEHAPLLDRAMYRASVGMCEPIEFKILQASGERRWVRALCQQVMEDGKFVGMNGILLDIDDRKKEESSLLAAVEKLKVLLDVTAEKIAVVDLEGRITFASPDWVRELGCQLEGELLGRNGFTLISPDSESEAKRLLAESIKGDSIPVMGTLDFITEHGMIVTVNMDIFPMLDHPLIEGLVCRMKVVNRRPLHTAA